MGMGCIKVAYLAKLQLLFLKFSGTLRLVSGNFRRERDVGSRAMESSQSQTCHDGKMHEVVQLVAHRLCLRDSLKHMDTASQKALLALAQQRTDSTKAMKADKMLSPVKASPWIQKKRTGWKAPSIRRPDKPPMEDIFLHPFENSSRAEFFIEFVVTHDISHVFAHTSD